MFDDTKHVVDVLPPVSDWLCVGIVYGTTAPLAAVLLGLGVDGTLYVVSEWRWDSRQRGRQLTDVEYSRALRDWLQSVKLPASNLTGPQPRFMVIYPSAMSFKVQMYQDGWAVADTTPSWMASGL
jgi:hypothetical protein